MVCTDCGKLVEEAVCSCGNPAIVVVDEESLKRCPLKVRVRLAIAESYATSLAEKLQISEAKVVALKDRVGILKGKLQNLKKKVKK